MAVRLFYLGLASVAALSATIAPASTGAEDAAGLEALRAADQRVAAIAFRLVTANAVLCTQLNAVSGLVLHDLSQYRPSLRPLATGLFALGPGLGVSSVVPDGPAARAGIRPDDRIVAVNGRSLLDADIASPPTAEASDRPFAAKLAVLEQELGRGRVDLTIERGSDRLVVSLVPVAGCASRFQLVPGQKQDAWADGRYVSLTTAMLDLVADDDELAVVLSHELAHNVLQHRARLRSQGVPTGLLRAFGRNAARVMATETEADRYGLRMMARSGFRLAAAESFWRRFAAASGLMLSTTHPGLKARLAIVRETRDALARESRR